MSGDGIKEKKNYEKLTSGLCHSKSQQKCVLDVAKDEFYILLCCFWVKRNVKSR